VEGRVVKKYIVFLAFNLLYISLFGALKKTENASYIKIKKVASYTGEFSISYGAATNKGKRDSMQDYVFINEDSDHFFFGLFDGHGSEGHKVAKFVQKKIYSEFRSNLFQKRVSNCNETEINEALKKTFQNIDKNLIKKGPKRKINRCGYKGEKAAYDSGTTAVISLICKNKLYTANCGDSPAVLGCGKKVDILSENHDIFNSSEIDRLNKEASFGKSYSKGSRIDGYEITRALGDYINKKELISLPYTTNITIQSDSTLVIMSDGVSDNMSHKKINAFVQKKFKSSINPKQIAKALLLASAQKDMSSLAHRISTPKNTDFLKNTHDNQSAIVVSFQKKKKN